MITKINLIFKKPLYLKRFLALTFCNICAIVILKFHQQHKNYVTMLRRLLLNAIGSYNGYSCCSNCKNRWNWVRGENVPITPALPPMTSGVQRFIFPLCTSCFESLSAPAIISYCNQQIDTWHHEDHRLREEYKMNAALSVLQMKKRAGEGSSFVLSATIVH